MKKQDKKAKKDITKKEEILYVVSYLSRYDFDFAPKKGPKGFGRSYSQPMTLARAHGMIADYEDDGDSYKEVKLHVLGEGRKAKIKITIEE